MLDSTLLIWRQWKLIAALTIAATALAFIVSLLSPKEYLGVVTALPANSATTDKARLLNPNIEGLYPELGSPDELDRIEGIVQLDTLYLIVASELSLPAHYKTNNEANELYKAATLLRKQTEIRRSAYGELKIKVWDKDAVMAATIANRLLQKLNELYGALARANNEAVLTTLRKSLLQKKLQLDSLNNDLSAVRSSDSDTLSSPRTAMRVNTSPPQTIGNPMFLHQAKALQESIDKQAMLIEEYSLAISLRPQILIPVETARPALKPDRPKTLRLVGFAFGASLLFSFLLALFIEGRKSAA